MSALVLLPIVVTAVNADAAGWPLAVALLWRPLVGELLLNTLALIACVTAACGIIGTAAAWAVERTDLPGRRFWAVLAVVPLAIPAFISSYAWLSLNSAFATFRRRAAGGDDVLLPAGLSTGRGGAAGDGPGFGRNRAGAGQ